MIYVDSLVRHPCAAYRNPKAARVGARCGNSWCHLFAYTAEELHAFARRIGLRREWAQVSSTGILHYDLTALRRIMAVDAGARELHRREAVMKMIQIREALREYKG